MILDYPRLNVKIFPEIVEQVIGYFNIHHSVTSPQAGLYRLSGADRTVKELKEKFLRSKTVPVLSKVDDIHAITGLLKDFLRNLKEPLLTFRLNHVFMDAAGACLCVYVCDCY